MVEDNSILSRSGRKGKGLREIRAKRWIDASGDGDLAVRAGDTGPAATRHRAFSYAARGMYADQLATWLAWRRLRRREVAPES